MTSTNDVTNDRLVSKTTSDKYRNNWDAIFGKKKKPTEERKDKKVK